MVDHLPSHPKRIIFLFITPYLLFLAEPKILVNVVSGGLNSMDQI